ncbi:MAG TPA: saccharopine dehydrogenase NADP-binding domain-containing protein, partial [Chryseosolibacter sp.]|nr:saccharopine dehydrogenase NADP-binding domain-containing protein [Chryseosolibacter sp.]
MNSRDKTILLYGSYGFTGRLIAGECKSRGLQVILSGRRWESLEKQSRETGYPFEVVDLDNAVALRRLLEKGQLVIHCAGPFRFTARAMVEMCLETGTHYTDITGEYQVLEFLKSYDLQAQKAGITILPATGFDVVPSDCLALHLKNLLPAAVRLQLAFSSSGKGVSRGTARTRVEGLGEGSVVRIAGELVKIPLGQKTKVIDFGAKKLNCLNIPWGDLATAWRSTGIPNIEVYAAASTASIRGVRILRFFDWATPKLWLKKMLLQLVDKHIAGPSMETVNLSRSFLWGKVVDASGNSEAATLETLNGYKLTSKTSVLIAEKILNGDFRTGYQTPGTAYGPDLILEIE